MKFSLLRLFGVMTAFAIVFALCRRFIWSLICLFFTPDFSEGFYDTAQIFPYLIGFVDFKQTDLREIEDFTAHSLGGFCGISFTVFLLFLTIGLIIFLCNLGSKNEKKTTTVLFSNIGEKSE